MRAVAPEPIEPADQSRARAVRLRRQLELEGKVGEPLARPARGGDLRDRLRLGAQAAGEQLALEAVRQRGIRAHPLDRLLERDARGEIARRAPRPTLAFSRGVELEGIEIARHLFGSRQPEPEDLAREMTRRAQHPLDQLVEGQRRRGRSVRIASAGAASSPVPPGPRNCRGVHTLRGERLAAREGPAVAPARSATRGADRGPARNNAGSSPGADATTTSHRAGPASFERSPAGLESRGERSSSKVSATASSSSLTTIETGRRLAVLEVAGRDREHELLPGREERLEEEMAIVVADRAVPGARVPRHQVEAGGGAAAREAAVDEAGDHDDAEGDRAQRHELAERDPAGEEGLGRGRILRGPRRRARGSPRRRSRA